MPLPVFHTRVSIRARLDVSSDILHPFNKFVCCLIVLSYYTVMFSSLLSSDGTAADWQ